MDLTPFKQDIDDLLNEFTQEGFTTFADMKRVWLSRKFSYIYEGRPKINSAVFMQSLYAHCIGHMISKGSLSWRLAGLYCLYCLHKTQPFKPCFKIYLSLGELKQLKNMVVDAKQHGIGVGPALVKKMLERNMFLFGFVDIVDGSVTQRVEETTKVQNKLVQIAYEKLLSNTKIEDYLHMDLGVELDLKGLKKMSSEYAKSKELAMADASAEVDVEDIRHIAQKKHMVADTVEEIVDEWDAQKEVFYRQTGVSCCKEIVAMDDFDKELEHLLYEE